MAEAALTFLLDNLKQLISHHYNLISGAKNELCLLQNELNLMKSFLKDASEKTKKEELFKEWERQIREVVYEVEDIIDACIPQPTAKTGNSSSKALSKMKSSFSRTGVDLAAAVRSVMKDKVKPVFNQAKVEFLNLLISDASDIRVDSTNGRNKTPRKDNIVGFEDETEKLVGYLLEESETLEVISIIGMPGLGKTTVAWKIYQDQKIGYEFPTLIWVHVSQDLNKKDLFLTILKKFKQEDMSSKSADELVPIVYECLERGKVLIVMDDVWTIDTWNEIQEVLPKTNSGCKVLITSREEKVAWHVNRRRQPHRLRFLNNLESWQLLQLEVFCKLDGFPLELETVGKLIAEQCGGLPLAIIVIGGILVGKFSITGAHEAILRKEWEKVSDTVKSSLIHDDQERRMEKIISLSYTKLPYHLRESFLYLGMFPEDTEISAWKLIQLWIAEGFIEEKPQKSLEEVAMDNLRDLINRNVVMVEKIKPLGEVKTCRIHGTIREFCKNEASFAKQNLFREIKMSKQGVFDPPIQIIEKYRRLSIHSYVTDFLLKTPKVPKARSFICISKEPIILESKDIAAITNAFQLLRVLDVNTIKFPKFPSNFTKLLHLRYVTLSGDNFSLLPEAISNLWNLRTLIIDTLSRTLDVKANILKMMYLRHFKTKASIILNKEMVKGEYGENLRTLTRLSPESCTNEVFSKAKNISTLGIRGELGKILDTNCLGKLKFVEKLKLVNDVFPKVPSETPLQNFPHSDRFPPNLKFLTLSATYLEWRHMSTVAQITNLEVLKVKDCAFVGNRWDTSNDRFLRLDFLYIGRTDLKFWKTTQEAFPVLRSLVLTNCEKLETVPLELGNKLEMLYVERVPKSVADSARKIKENKLSVPAQQRSIARSFKLVVAPGVE